MKKIALSIVICAALGCSTGCLSPDGGLQPMPWWPMGGEAWNKPATSASSTAATKPPTSPPVGAFNNRQGMATNTNAPVPQRPSGEAISVSVGDE